MMNDLEFTRMVLRDPEEDPKEDDDDVMEMDDEAEVIDPYIDDGSNNPPPPNSEDEETPHTSAVIPDADGQPIPPIASFNQNFHFGKSSSTANLLTRNSKIVLTGPMYPNLGTAWKRAVRNVMSDLSGLKKLVKDLSDRFDEYEGSKVFEDKKVLENELVNERKGKEFYQEFGEYMCRMLQNRQKSEDSFPLPLGSDAAIAAAAVATSGIDDDDTESVEAAIRAERERERVQNEANRAGGPNVASVAQECTFVDFMKCSPITFSRNEGAVGLIRWIEKTKMVFTVATLGIEAVTRKTWAEMKVMMTEEFCPPEEIQRMERKKVEAYIRGLSENIKGKVTSSEPTTLNKAVRMAHTLMEQKVKAIAEREADNKKRKWENFQGGNSSGGGNSNSNGNNNNYPSNRRSRACGQAYALRDGDQNLGPNVVTGTFLLNNHYARVLFDSGSDKSFMNVNFSHLIAIEPVKVDPSYEVELADGRVVSTNTILRGCTLNLVNHLFEIDLMPIELGTFDVIIGMDWLILHDAVIVCGKKEVHVPLKKRTLVVKGDDCVSRLKVLSCMKVKKYVDRESYLFFAQVIEKEPAERRLEDVPVICKFLDVFPEDFP
nr:reverse transcriptase domain-containing protein [Tanacetum cinerariifolium]